MYSLLRVSLYKKGFELKWWITKIYENKMYIKWWNKIFLFLYFRISFAWLFLLHLAIIDAILYQQYTKSSSDICDQWKIHYVISYKWIQNSFIFLLIFNINHYIFQKKVQTSLQKINLKPLYIHISIVLRQIQLYKYHSYHYKLYKIKFNFKHLYFLFFNKTII